jgi:tRNA threonylcarbamoyl adenosine modification protein YjeE
MEKICTTPEELQKEAQTFAQSLSPHTDKATLITLSGELGAGKTSFTQGLARSFGVTVPILSPTFVLEKIYNLSKESGRGFAHLVHIDLYRLEDKKDLEHLNFEEAMNNSQNLIVLEWPERVPELHTGVHTQIQLEILPTTERKVTYANHS